MLAQEAIHLTLDRFPETLKLQLGVGGMGLECPEGTLIRTGGELHRLVSATDLTGAAGAAACRMTVGAFVCTGHTNPMGWPGWLGRG